MVRVFISYASEDRMLADELHRWLIDDGHEVFLDHDMRHGIAVGESWQRWIHERLRWADAVACLVTSAYLASTWCAAEIGIAQSRGIRLLPLRAERGVVHPMLGHLQHADYTWSPDAARAELTAALRLFAATWPEGRSPFPGLRPFEVDQHQVFFGRTDEVKQLTELLRSSAQRAEGTALLVVGPSGCGKSSLVRAGLLPVMADEPGWLTLAPIVSGADPVAALARELASATARLWPDWTEMQVRYQLDAMGFAEIAEQLLQNAPGGPHRRLLVVTDQFEELLTQTAPRERARFVELLGPALAGPVQLVGTLRSEFLDQLIADPDLNALTPQVYLLRPLRREALRSVIEAPAQLAGLEVDDRLVTRLVDDTDNGEALPLLAFTLAELADGVGRGGRLSAARYEQLAGVRGALTRQADAALKDAISAGGRSREQVIAGLLRLVTVNEQGHPTRRRVNRDELPDQVVTELDAFVARRLLITDIEDGVTMIGVAHEAFLSAWSPLDQEIAANVSALKARRTVEQAASEWHQNQRPNAWLWGGGQLAATVTEIGVRICAASASPSGGQGWPRWLWRHRALVTDRVDISPEARDFIHASIRGDRYRRRRSTTVLSVLLVVAVAAAGFAAYQQRDAREQQRIAVARQLITQADAVRETDPRTALLLGIAAERIRPGAETQASLVNTLTSTRYAGTLTHHTSSVTSVAFSPDGRTLATGDSDGNLLLWDRTARTHPRRSLAVHTSAVTWLAFSPDGRTLITGSFDGLAVLWDLTDPAHPRQPLTVRTGSVSSIAFSPDARTVATGSFEGTVTMWDLADTTRPRQRGSLLTGRADAAFSAAFSPDGRMLAIGDSEGAVILWDLASPTRPGHYLAGHTGAVNSVAFSSDGRMLATASDDTTTRLWDLSDPTRPQPIGSALTSHTRRVTAVAFSADGRTLATASDDTTTRLWNLSDPTRPQPIGSALTSHTSRVTAVTFASDGTLATASSDGTVILWELTERVRPLGQPLTGQPSPVDSVMFTSEGTLASTSSDGTVILRDPKHPDRPRLGPAQQRSSSLVDSLASTSDGNTVVTASGDGHIILWDLTNPTQQRPLGKPLTGHRRLVTSAAFTPDGRTLATASDDGTVILWNLTDRAQPRRLGQPLAGHRRLVTSAAFTPDGRTLATASDDGTVILWNLTDRAQPRRLGNPLTAHTGSVTSVAFAPDGNILATGGSDALVILWDLTDLHQLRDHATERACAITGRGLTPAEWDRYIPGLSYADTCHPTTGGGGPR